MASPTSRTLDYCRKQGWYAGIVERYIAQCRQRFDLFGCIDLVALDGLPGSLGIQATSGSNHSSRVKKALEEPRLLVWLEAGNRFEVWSWAKQGPKGKRKVWKLRQEPITLSSFKGYTENQTPDGPKEPEQA